MEVIRKTSTLIIAAILVLLTLLAYSDLPSNEFVNFDDPDYITSNRWVQDGVTWESIRWAVSSRHAENWHPLTWFSHMLDWEWFGGEPSYHHAVNLFWHILSGLSLFWLLAKTTGLPWPSALVAGVFLLHPLQVESVAWAAQRKSVLSTFFWMLTLVTYLRYVETKRWSWYLGVLIAATLALLAKPLAVTLPFVLLLLDYWPLRRSEYLHSECLPIPRRELVLEKLPLLAIAVLASIVTYFVQETAKTGVDVLPLAQRLENAILSYVEYLRLFFWPMDLAVLYPHPRDSIALGQVLASLAALVAITIVAWYTRSTRPYLLVGWLWYLGTLVPMIGIIQVGRQSHADRYAYVPMIGIGLMVAFGLWDLTRKAQKLRPIVAVLSCVWLVGLGIGTWHQVHYWRSSEALFRHTLAVTEDNSLAHYMLGIAIAEQGHQNEAIAEMRSALSKEPGEYNAHLAIASFLVRDRNYEEALQELNSAIEINPKVADSFYRRGELYMLLEKPDLALPDFKKAQALENGLVAAAIGAAEAHLRLGHVNEAERIFEMVLRENPNNAAAHNGLGVIRAQAGDSAASRMHFEKALAIDPKAVDPRRNLTLLLLKTGKPDEAEALLAEGMQVIPDPAIHDQLVGILVSERRYTAASRLLRQALQREPDNANILNNLAWILATSPGLTEKERKEALLLAQALPIDSGSPPGYQDTLAAAQAGVGDFEAAVKSAQQAILRAEKRGDLPLADRIRKRLELYSQGQAFVDDKTH